MLLRQFRSKPALKPISEIVLREPEKVTLDNGIPLFVINAGDQDVLMLEIFVKAGSWFSENFLLPSATAKLVKMGSAHKSARQISEEIEYYGASFKANPGYDHIGLTLYTLSKHLDQLLPLVLDILMEADFPQQEINTFARNKKQQLSINMQQNDYLADIGIRSMIFGADHPYGYSPDPEDYDRLSRDDLVRFHRERYGPANTTIILSGRTDPSLIATINRHLGVNWQKAVKSGDRSWDPQPDKEKKSVLKTGDTVQCSLRLGRSSIPKDHPDYHKLNFTNLLFGGHFGSRLMSNLREDKGFTYGIYSGLANYLGGDYQYITAEVNAKNADVASREIYSELERLINEAVEQKELDTVKSYVMGSLLNNVDGPFNTASTIRNLVLYGLSTAHFSDMLSSIRAIEPVEIQQIATKYFRPEDFFELRVF